MFAHEEITCPGMLGRDVLWLPHRYIYTSGCVADGEFGGRVIINRFDKHCIILRMENIHPKHSHISSTQTPRLNKEEIKTHIQPYLFAGRHEVTSLSLRL